MADLQNVQEVVATMLSSHAATLASLQQTVSQQASAIASLTLTTTAADAKISNLEAQLSEAKAQIPALQSISPKVEALEVRLASTIHTVQEQWQQQMLSGRESPDRGSPHHGLSASPVRGNVASHDLSSLHSRVECLELKNHVESNNAEIKRIVHDLVQLRFEEARPAVPSPSPSSHAQSSRNDDLSSDVADLRVEVASLSQLLSSTATPDDLEDVRDELYRYIASLPSPAATPSCSKENDNPSLKNAILDEVAISRPDRTEIERLVMSRLEPIAGSLNTLHAEFATVNRHVNSLPPVPPGLVDQSQLGNTVNDAVRKALSGDGGRVSHAHLTVAIDNAREGMLRQMEGSIGSVRASLLENFSGELGNAKESTWDAVASLRGRVDDLERIVDVSNTEIVSVLNKKAYKNDVTAALSKKADKDVCMNTLRLKADSNKVDSSLTTKADAVETSERINQVSVAVTSSARDVSSLRDELRQEVTQLSEKLKRKVDVDEVEGLKLGVVSGADWRNAVSDVSMNIRRELADKANREEMVKMIRREVDNVKENVEGLQVRQRAKRAERYELCMRLLLLPGLLSSYPPFLSSPLFPL